MNGCSRQMGRGMRPGLRLLGLVVLCLLFKLPLWGLDPNRAIHQYGRDRWTRQTGLPGSVVSGVSQSTDGYLWLQCGGSLYRFDGVRFTGRPLQLGGSPLEETIRAVGKASRGRLLIRTSNHTLVLADGEYREATPPFHLPDGSDRVVMEARDGTLWLGTDNHIYRYRSGELSLIASGIGWVRDLLEDRDGAIWVAGSAALYRIKNDRVQSYPTFFAGGSVSLLLPVEPSQKASSRLPEFPSTLFQDRKGTLWVGTLGGLWKWRDGVLFQDEEARGIGSRAVNTLLQDRDGNLWVGTDGQGLFRLAQGRWSRFTSEDGLSDDTILGLHEDQEGSLWIGTRTALDRFRNAPMLSLTARDGLPNENTASVLQARDGSVFVFTFGGGIARFKDGLTQIFSARDGLGSNVAGCLFESRDGVIWAGTDHGLSAYRNGRWQTTVGDGRLKGLYISAISEDEESLIIGCSDLNLYRFKDGKLSPYNLNLSADGKPAGVRYAFTILKDSEGALWFGLSGGLYKVDKAHPPENALRTAFTDTPLCITEDRQGYLWMVGSNTGGFFRMRKQDGSLAHFLAEDGAALDSVGRILCDEQGDVWMNTRSGILHFGRAELDAYAEGKIKVLHHDAFGTIDGLQTEDCAGMTPQPAAWRGEDGRMYFTSRKGLVVFNPENLPKNALVPQVHIEEVMADRVALWPSGNLVLEAGVENLEIHYSATSLQVPSRVRFRYQLVGFDPDWVDAGSRRTAYYTRIPPGRYQFRVIACNDDGLWNTAGATLALRLRPHFYQTPWFLVLVGVVLAALTYSLHLYRTRWMRLRHVELESLVADRTRELDQHRARLEELVQERTQELSQSNRRLEREVGERRQGEQALRKSEDRYRRFFEEDVAGAFIAKPDGQGLAFNPAFARMLGVSEHVEAGHFDLMQFFPDPFQLDELIARIRRDGKVLGCEFEMERSNGKPLHILANLVGQFDAEGHLVEIKGYVLDTTARKDLEEQLRQSQKMEAVGQLAGGVAHDFNNLLTVILTCCGFVLDELSASPEVKSMVEEIREAGDRAAALTRQLLAFSRRQVLQPKNLDINAVVVPMEKMLRRLIGEPIRLSLSLGPGHLFVKADPAQMEQVLLNLVVNARDAMPRGGSLEIETSFFEPDASFLAQHPTFKPIPYVRLSIKDTGSGIRPDVLPHIFEPFFTTKGLGQGTGLGLSTVYGIVHQSEGEILCQSEVGKGTCFQVLLPRIHFSDAADPVPAVDRSVATRDSLILLVEDNEPVRRLTSHGLLQGGYRVVEASSGEEALEKVAHLEGRIDLLLTDVVMAGMNGKVLADRLRERWPDIPLVFMSGYTNEALVPFGMEAENILLLEKPFTMEMLLERVATAMGQAPPRA